MLNHALKYLTNGASVMPVGKDKRPLLASWLEFQNRLPTVQEVTDWWTKWPEANIGVITGKISGLTVVDVEAGGDISRLPTTDTVQTGGGGWHFYYAYEPGYTNKTRIFPLTDVRGDGGYVVAPPSIHQSGNVYKVITQVGRAKFPIELFGGQKRSAVDWKEVVSGIPQGSRNDTATKVAGKLLRTFAPNEWEAIVWPMMRQWNASNQPPLGEYELRQTYTSIAKRELGTRKTGKDEALNDVLENELPLTFTTIVERAVEELDSTNEEDIVEFGYPWLDDKLTGFFKGELVVMGGETGTGKTTFATNIIYKASKKHKCYVFALEDRLNDYGIKTLYFEIGRVIKKYKGKEAKNYPWNDYRRNKIADPNYKTYRAEAVENIKNDNIQMYNTEQMIDIDILEKLIEKKVKEGVDLFLLDHLHYFDLLKGDSSKADYIEKLMVRIKTLQNRTGARIIMVVHYKKLNGQKPSLDSFKDSISIVQNANYVINLWRDRSEGADEKRFKTILTIPKSRNPNGEATFELTFDPETNDYELFKESFGTFDDKKEKLEVDDFNIPL